MWSPHTCYPEHPRIFVVGGSQLWYITVVLKAQLFWARFSYLEIQLKAGHCSLHALLKKPGIFVQQQYITLMMAVRSQDWCSVSGYGSWFYIVGSVIIVPHYKFCILGDLVSLFLNWEFGNTVGFDWNNTFVICCYIGVAHTDHTEEIQIHVVAAFSTLNLLLTGVVLGLGIQLLWIMFATLCLVYVSCDGYSANYCSTYSYSSSKFDGSFIWLLAWFSSIVLGCWLLTCWIWKLVLIWFQYWSPSAERVLWVVFMAAAPAPTAMRSDTENELCCYISYLQGLRHQPLGHDISTYNFNEVFFVVCSIPIYKSPHH